MVWDLNTQKRLNEEAVEKARAHLPVTMEGETPMIRDNQARAWVEVYRMLLEAGMQYHLGPIGGTAMDRIESFLASMKEKNC